MSDWLGVAASAAEIGGEVLRRSFRRLEPGQIAEKERFDWVTAADRASEEAIVAFLRRHTPGFAILAEESGMSAGSGSRWVIDPLDGTLNFVRGFPHFAVSVALERDGVLEAGAIYDPMRDQLFTAQRGGGAFCNGRPIRVSGKDGLDGAVVTTGFPYRVLRFLDVYLAVFRDVFVRTAALRRPGAAALDLAHTAAGIFDGFFEFCLSPWDLAAGVLLVREAGGEVSNLDGGEEVFVRGNVVAASPDVHRDLLAVTRRHCREDDIAP